MAAPGEICLVYATFPDADSARRAAHALVEGHLAACCNLLPPIESIYFWNGHVQEGPETAMLVKTTTALAPAAMAAIATGHPYENPAILQLPVSGGSADFLGWIASTVLPAHSPR